MTNSTFSGNYNNGPGAGGGILNANASTLTLTNSTLSGNSSLQGGGIFNVSTLTINNTIVAHSTGGDIFSTHTISSSNNLIQDGSGGLTGTITGDPLLGPLQNNGGPTQTMAPLPGSPAIDAGNNRLIPPGVTTDQRGTGFPRIVNGTVNIGAFEGSIASTRRSRPPP